MLIYIDEQCLTNPYIREKTIPELPADVEVTTDRNRIPQADIYVAGLVETSGETIRSAKNLKVIVRNAVGTDNIDMQTARELNIPVYNLPLVNFESVAEMTIGYMIAAGRYMVFNHINNTKNIRKDYYRNYQGQELYGKTFGIIGFGHIGRRLADILTVSFNGRVLFYDPYVSEEEGLKHHAQKADDYYEILRQADFVSIHAPLTKETANMIDQKALEQCKSNCILINAARSGIVDEQALYEALKQGKIAYGVSDVLSYEENNPLFTLDNFIGTSHICGNAREARIRVAEHLLERLLTEIDKIRSNG